ncbi:Short-chain collagen C4 [Holothuria leucospilota]|uniref:Short-chain collagen C4 n=1 Tax=Holothuria leucospilota TaxID=206669 RepID=A0A9Q0YHF8_HOLLE|nr:Short-chain collagen C4 [Holothuria leucospilota]
MASTKHVLRWIIPMIMCNLPSGKHLTSENDKDEILDIGREISELKSSIRILHHKLDAEIEMQNSKTNRPRRSVENGTLFTGNECPGAGCPTLYTPHFSGQCFLCPPGTSGPRGPPGQQGIPGRDGRDGRDAIAEPETRRQQSVFDISDIPEISSMYTRDIDASGGAVYVRWGRTECPTYSELVYHGVAGGGHYNLKGSGANHLCMPEDPIHDEPVPGSGSQDRGYVYGAEYEMNTFANWDHLHNNNVPCAVCLAPGRPSLMMIPARNVCPGNEWTKEYSGYLVSSYHNHHGRSKYVCMDRKPEVIPRTVHNADGLLFYVVESKCGASGSGLPCGPYVDGYELTCAVCTL